MSEEEVMQDEEEHYTGTFYGVCRNNGHSVRQAQELRDWRMGNIYDIEHVHAQLSLRRVVPIEVFDSYGGWDNLTVTKREHILWLAGLNTNKYPYHKDIGVYHIGTKHQFGWHIFGQERTDKVWIQQKVDGVRVASDEAVLSYRSPNLNRNKVEDYMKLDKPLKL